MQDHYLIAVTGPGGIPLGSVTILPDDDSVYRRHRGRVFHGTGVLGFWRGWHARTFIKFYKRLGWKLTLIK